MQSLQVEEEARKRSQERQPSLDLVESRTAKREEETEDSKGTLYHLRAVDLY